MLDDVTKVKISKTDIADSNEIPGAKLMILDEDDRTISSACLSGSIHCARSRLRRDMS